RARPFSAAAHYADGTDPQRKRSPDLAGPLVCFIGRVARKRLVKHSNRQRSRDVARSLGMVLFFSIAFSLLTIELQGQAVPPPESFQVLPPTPDGPQITPYLQYQTDLAWRQDAERMGRWRAIHTEQELLQLQKELRTKVLSMMGGLPAVRTPLNARIVGTIP